MRIADRYQSLMDRVGPSAGRNVDKTDKSNASAGARGPAAKKPSAGSGAAVQVNVSDRAQELAAGAARLEELKSSIQDGTYEVNPKVIASRLLGEEDGE